MEEETSIYRAALESMVDGVVIQDAEGRIVYLNPAAKAAVEMVTQQPSPEPSADAAGATRSPVFRHILPPLVGENDQMLPPDDGPAVRALATQTPVVGEMIKIPVDGTDRWFRCNAVPLDPAQAGDEMVALSFADATAERRLAGDLHHHERQFRLALRYAPIGMALVSIDGRFIDVNDALCELTQRSRADLLARTFQDITHPDDLDADLERLNQLIDGVADDYQIDKRYLTPTGAIVQVQLNVAIVRVENDDPYFIAQIINLKDQIEALRRQEDALRREREVVAKLQDLAEAKSNFVSTVSHELRTPLTSTIGFLELLADGDAGPLSAQQNEMIGVIERNSQRLLALVEDLLSISASESGQVRRAVENVDLARLVTDAVATQRPIARGRDVDLKTDIDRRAAVVAGDQHQLERIVVQLVGNALKFTNAGGEVHVSTESVENGVHLRVSDTGIGIPFEEQEGLFNRFFRSSTARSEAIPGTGLGLAIVHELVRTHGGSIAIESTPGVGTTVEVTLPTLTSQASGDDGDAVSACSIALPTAANAASPAASTRPTSG